MQQNITDMQSVTSTSPDIITRDVPDAQAPAAANYTPGQIAIASAQGDELAEMNATRNNMASGVFNYKTAAGAPVGLNDVAGSVTTANGSVNYTYKDLIATATPDQFKDISEQMSESFHDAMGGVQNAYSKWNNVSQFSTTLFQTGSGVTTGITQAGQASATQDQGAQQALIQNSQGQQTILGQEQSAVTDARNTAQQNILGALQMLQTIVRVDTQG
jgi:hypothetical protein